MFGVMASLPVKGHFSLSLQVGSLKGIQPSCIDSNLIFFCTFSCEEKSVLQDVQCYLSKGKRNLKLQNRTNKQLAVWEEGNLGAR